MLTLRLDQGSRLNQGKARLGQGTTMDWSGDGRWMGMHTARQAEPGHGTAVVTAVLGSGTRPVGAVVQGANRRGALLGLTAGLGGRGGGRAFGIVTENEASPLPLNKALTKLKSL